MAAVVRVKRRLDEEPLDLIVLNCKKRKTDEENEEKSTKDLSAVLQFAGTLNEDENIHSLLKKHSVTDINKLKDQFKKHPVSVTDKIRLQIQENSKNNRFKVVSCYRSKNFEDFENDPPKTDVSTSGSDEEAQFTIFDIETDCNDNDSVTKNRNLEGPTFVYDLYYTNSDDFGETDINDYISIHPINDPLVFGSIRDNGLNEIDSDDDSEDSNAECNWKNDYPDESDMESVNEDDMVKAIEKITVDEDLLSTDEEEEKYVYNDDEEDQNNFVEEDVSRFGKMYAKFKAKNKDIETTGVGQDLYYGDIDEEEYYY